MLNFKEVIYLEKGNKISWNTVNIIDTKESYTDIRNELISKISNKELDLKSIKTLHFTSGCEVPRYKLKEFNKTHGLSTIRDVDKAGTWLFRWKW